MNACKDCSHLIGVRRLLEDAAGWRCAHPSNIHEVCVDPVTGEDVRSFHNSTCYEARKATGLCGPTGSLFQQYEPPVYSPSVGRRVGSPSKSADELLGELDV